MNILHLPTFDDALADSMKLAAVRQIVEQATGFAEAQIKKSHEPTEWQDPGMHYANIAGILDATVDGLVAYLGQIALTCKPDDPLPHLDDLGGDAA